MTAMESEYPVRLEIDPAASQNRLTVFFRPILTIPHWIAVFVLGIAAFFVWLFASLSIVVTARYPEGLLWFSTGFARWSTRVSAYGGTLNTDLETYISVTGGFLTDKYPPFTLGEAADYPVRLHVQQQVEGRNRLTGFFPVRIIMLIPHFIVLAILGIVVSLATIVAWLGGTVLGGLPEWLHDFIAGYTRWGTRVGVYGGLLVDEYPPFSFN
ncbi:MAG: DUF4389 domain-containing protein [Chloroflexota bacterium]|nr:DUF4389 domain-containing protein [Chloroflexota bacterium]